jgi:hypothetical protein
VRAMWSCGRRPRWRRRIVMAGDTAPVRVLVAGFPAPEPRESSSPPLPARGSARQARPLNLPA